MKNFTSSKYALLELLLLVPSLFLVIQSNISFTERNRRSKRTTPCQQENQKPQTILRQATREFGSIYS